MRRNGTISVTVFSLLLLSVTALHALEVPSLSGRVTDLAGVVSSGTEADLTSYLEALEEEAGIQIAVLTIPSLEGEPLERYSIRVVDEWGLGSASEDNGALLLVALQDKKIRIEVGYGLEGTLTDVKSGLIIREILQPAFRAGDYDGGISAAVHTMGEVASGRTDIAVKSTDTRTVSTASSDSGTSVGFVVNLVIFMIIFSLGSLGRRRRYGGFGRALFWTALLGSSGRHRTYRSGGFGGSGFSGGGFGGGGFSGGGGGFGGGGASGGW